MYKQIIIFSVILSALIMAPTFVYAEHIFKTKEAFAQYLDTIKTTGEFYTIEVDDATFDIYYGGYGSIEIGGEALEEGKPTLSSMSINLERKSLEIILDPIPNDKIFWVLLPLEVISAEEAQYQLFIDGVETKYDLTKFPGNYALGMVLPPGAEHLEIIGTKVIPEFGTYAILILGISIFGLIYYIRRSSFNSYFPSSK